MRVLLLPFEARFIPLTLVLCLTLGAGALAALHPATAIWTIPVALVFGAVSLIGLTDLVQPKHAILRNYPLAAHLRFLLERIRPEIRQYFLEDDKDGMPFPRDKRAIVYQRAKRQLDKRPFGTQYNVYDSQFEWLHHSMAPKTPSAQLPRVVVGGSFCRQPYAISVFNISAMSYGALSANAVRALNKGAKLGGFAHDTGEGGFTPYHREHGGDIIWEIGSGYFGCRDEQGRFDLAKFSQVATHAQIKMVEIKLSQGAKPGHGGVLPAAKVTREIARIRGVKHGKDCISPPFHTAFGTPVELLQFVNDLRNASGGKPTGFKLCIGHPWEFLAIVKAMLATGLAPDFIVVDGKEGGTGAAPLEFIDHIGMPLRDGLSLVHNALLGAGLRDRVKLGASGKIISAFDMARVMALGADWCNAARGFMFAVGCIQAQTCHSGECPTGVTAQGWSRQRAVVVADKGERVASYHRETLHALAELVAAAGLDAPSQLRPEHFMRREGPHRFVSYAQLYTRLAPGELLSSEIRDEAIRAWWAMAQADSFAPLPAGPAARTPSAGSQTAAAGAA